jgi:hypothetical protein
MRKPRVLIYGGTDLPKPAQDFVSELSYVIQALSSPKPA